MTIAQMLEQSGILTLLGMCVVFSFLVIMIAAMNILRVFIKALHLDKEPEKSDTSSSSGSAPVVGTQDNGAVIAAIAAAVHEKESV
ncbi:sodium pump decarboxylase subunit gamma [Treponema rectale]|uniref:Oxaloacetate decarboxylase gamma subunit n=1 Tax=Treponema rectale TaxID=744512 RepID=A0A840SAV0_9SPIR|nr:OadG family protein [Treponema rectale]MBB5217944.1 oxaloacetate decarboxylase gamma subunit [Treponema rectale]QOS40338.1 sodium pump decarboxylase subunit gamma [Treponema rectale]